MTEGNVLQLLQQIVHKEICEVDLEAVVAEKAGGKEALTELSARLAEQAWTAVLLLLRENLAASRQAVIDEVGIVSLDSEGWHFIPAASLNQAASLAGPVEHAEHTDPVQWLTFHLDQATSLAAGMGRDLDVPTSVARTKAALMRAIFGESVRGTVAQMLADAAVALNRHSKRLRTAPKRSIPIEQLPLTEKEAHLLRRLGVSTVDDLIDRQDLIRKLVGETSWGRLASLLGGLGLGGEVGEALWEMDEVEGEVGEAEREAAVTSEGLISEIRDDQSEETP